MHRIKIDVLGVVTMLHNSYNNVTVVIMKILNTTQRTNKTIEKHLAVQNTIFMKLFMYWWAATAKLNMLNVNLNPWLA